MIGEGNRKLCVTRDVSQLAKGGSASCSICCARSEDKSLLCDPVESFGDNLFCDPRA
jgi:hypothetical protein